MLNRLFRRALKEKDGTIAAMFALSLLLIVPLLVLVTDMTYGYFVQAKLQTTASVAALAAASQLAPDDPAAVIADLKTAARSEADLYADTKNKGVGQDGQVTNTDDEDIIFGFWDESGDPEFCPDTDPCFSPGGIDRKLNAVKVFARRSNTGGHNNALPLFIAAVLPELSVQPSAVATAIGGGPYNICILALNEANPDAIYVNGNNDVAATDCGICSNGGIRAGGNPTIDVGETGDIIYWDDGPGLTDIGNVHWEPEGTMYPHGEDQCADPIGARVPPLFNNNWDDPCADLTNPLLLAAAFVKPPGPIVGGKMQVNLQINPVPASFYEFGQSGASICGEIRKTGNSLIVDGIPLIDSSTEALVSIEFMPGLHHFKANPGSEPQDFNLNGGSDIAVSGTNVTILLSNIQLDWLGASQIDISAPEDVIGLANPGFDLALDEPQYLIYQNPYSPNGPASDDPKCNDGSILCHELGGSDGADLSGLIYTGLYSTFWFHGTQDTNEEGDCLAVIAGNIEFSGGTDISFSPSSCGSGLPQGFADLRIRLQD